MTKTGTPDLSNEWYESATRTGKITRGHVQPVLHVLDISKPIIFSDVCDDSLAI